MGFWVGWARDKEIGKKENGGRGGEGRKIKEILREIKGRRRDVLQGREYVDNRHRVYYSPC